MLNPRTGKISKKKKPAMIAFRDPTDPIKEENSLLGIETPIETNLVENKPIETLPIQPIKYIEVEPVILVVENKPEETILSPEIIFQEVSLVENCLPELHIEKTVEIKEEISKEIEEKPKKKTRKPRKSKK